MDTGWKPSEAREGYRQKTIIYGNCTITIHRPELTPDQRAKREREVINALAAFARKEGTKCAST